MPSEIQLRTPNAKEQTLSWVFPGDTAFIDRELAEGLGKHLVLVCCDNNDECTDVFVFDTPEGVTNPAQQIDPDDVCTTENLVAQVKHGDYHTLDMQALGLTSRPAELVMNHRTIMNSN